MIRNVTNNVRYIKNNQDKLTFNIKELELAMDFVYKIESMEDTIAQMVLGLHRLEEGKVDPALLPMTQAALALEQLITDMEHVGLKPIISHPIEIYGMPITYVFFEESVEIFIQIPGVAIRDYGSKLYEFSPMGIIQDESGKFSQVETEASFIAVSEDLEYDAQVIEFTEKEFTNKCRKTKEKSFACIRPRIIKKPKENCLSSIFFGHGTNPCITNNLFKVVPLTIIFDNFLFF